MNIALEKSRNARKTFVMFAVFLGAAVALGWVFGQAFQSPGILYFAVFFSFISAGVSYWYSDKIALTMARAKKIERGESPELWDLVENLSIRAGIPAPVIYISPEEQINAFATGRSPKHAAVCVTRGAIARLNRGELEGVLGHELSHVRNRDILVSTVAVILAGIISMLSDFFMRSLWFGGGRRRSNDREGNVFFYAAIIMAILAPIGAFLLQLAISRRRESLADASGAEVTGNPQGLAAALEKIAGDQIPMLAAKTSTAHLWIDTPFKGRDIPWFQRLFMTHPPIGERIKKLREL